MDTLIGAQIDGGYRAPPFTAVAREPGTTRHNVEYRWKTLQAEIIDLLRENRE